MVYFIYALRFDDGRIYVGMTNNLSRRVAEHKRGKTKSIKNREKFKVICIETYLDRLKAHTREKYWKSGYGKERLKSASYF